MSDYKLTKPCAGCPFLRASTGVRGLPAMRLAEIVASPGGFTCHQTHPQTASSENVEPQECAGFLIYNLANRTPPNMMRLAGRLGMIDEDALMLHEDEVFTNLNEMIEAHHTFNGRFVGRA